MAESGLAVRIGLEGLPERVRSEVASAYRGFGGDFGSPSMRAMRQALRSVRRQAEIAGKSAISGELSRREDALEMACVDADVSAGRV